MDEWNMSTEHLWNFSNRRKLKHSQKNLLQHHFVHYKSHIDWPGTKPVVVRSMQNSWNENEFFSNFELHHCHLILPFSEVLLYVAARPLLQQNSSWVCITHLIQSFEYSTDFSMAAIPMYQFQLTYRFCPTFLIYSSNLCSGYTTSSPSLANIYLA